VADTYDQLLDLFIDILSRFQPHDSGPSSRVSTALASRPTR
jgi:hypothetical protein